MLQGSAASRTKVHRRSLHRGRLSEDSAVKKKKHFDNIFTVTKHVVGEGRGGGGCKWTKCDIYLGPSRLPMARLVWSQTHRRGGGGGESGWEGMRRHTRAFVVHSVQCSVGWGWGVLKPWKRQPPFGQDSFHLPPFSTAMPTAIGRGVGTGQTPLPTACSMAHARSARQLIGQTGLRSFSARTQLP